MEAQPLDYAEVKAKEVLQFHKVVIDPTDYRGYVEIAIDMGYEWELFA